MKTKTYYKVLIRVNKKLYSPFARKWHDKKKAAVRYVCNKWVHPKVGANPFLFVFDNLKTAQDWDYILSNIWCWRQKNNVIYECEIGEKVTRPEHIQVALSNVCCTTKVKLIKRIK